MSKPQRIQLKRTKGWRMPANTVKVDRTSKFGNPFSLKEYRETGYAGDDLSALTVCVAAFKAWMEGKHHWAHGSNMPPPPDVSSLRGKNLACWCKPGSPCHADVLLEIANK